MQRASSMVCTHSISTGLPFPRWGTVSVVPFTDLSHQFVLNVGAVQGKSPVQRYDNYSV